MTIRRVIRLAASFLRITLGATVALLGGPAALGQASTASPEEIVVIERFDALQRAGSGFRLDADVVADTRAEHVHELLVRVPGVLVSRGSGQEHLTAIRSAVLTGAGSCGAFLLLENGIPLRPHGTCNANGLFEAPHELAGSVAVVRGPASAIYGGNALHGAIDIQLPDPLAEAAPRVDVEVGRWSFGRITASAPLRFGDHALRIDALGAHTDGWRDDTGFGEQKLIIGHATDAFGFRIRNTLSATNLEQETGGFVTGKRAYRKSDLRDSNPNPEAFRDAWSARAASQWRNDTFGVDLYARKSRMRFLQHFLLGQPLEENGQTSAGGIVTAGWASDSYSARVGAQLEWATTDLLEDQARAAVGGAAAVGIRPIGVHYDYDVDSTAWALFYDGELALGSNLELIHSARYEQLNYDYDNHASDGNSRPDGTACGFGGCLFNRPADREDDFDSWAGRLGLRHEDGDGNATHLVIATGFRPPQTTELYRLQRGQNVADLDSERLDAIELGTARQLGAAVRIDAVAYYQRKRDFILRDAAGFVVSDGRSNGAGVELALVLAPPDADFAFDLALGYAQHRYDFDRAITGGETIRDGNDEDTAPQWLGSAHWSFQPTEQLRAELELVYQGRYELDAANTADYQGHLLVNLRADWRLTESVSVYARLMNLLDRDYADRADLAFGNERYFPGEPRRLFLGLTYSP